MPTQTRPTGTRLAVLFSLMLMPGLVGSTLAQSSGNNAISSGAGTIASTAFIDASAFYGSTIGGTNICAILNYIYTPANHLIPAGGAVIDARGIAVGQSPTSRQCTTNPWNGVTSPPPTTVLLPGGTIYISAQWTVPSGTHIIGEGRYTILTLTSTWTAPANNYMIQMGPASCPGGAPVVLEQFSFQPPSTGSGGNNVNGIDNECSGAMSYVDHIVFLWLSGVGINVGSGAANSGPYTNINYAAGDFCENQGIGTACPSQCVNLQAVTRGLHGITCTMTATMTNFRTDEAAIHVDAANSVEDTHFEGFYDGIVVGDTASAAGSSILHVTSGNGAGPVINSVHVCNPAALAGACTNYSGSSTANLGDIAISQVSNNTNSALLIKDDVTSTKIGVPPGGSSEYVTGLYALGQVVAGASSTLGYTRLNSSSATPTSLLAGAPMWATASSTTPATPCPIGSMFSNTGGTSKSNTIYVCESDGAGGTKWNAVN